jgi:2-dehydro-3-deoxygluconokinase
MGKILCIGETLLRLVPRLGQQWIKDQKINVFIGGAELNCAQALALWDQPTKYFTALPDHALTQEIIEYLNSKNIDTSAIQLATGRLGTYYLPQGADLKNAGVIYDRKDSSFAMLSQKDIDYDKVFEDVTWMHFSAINPAVSETMATCMTHLVSEAKNRKVTISIDLNYRAKLWQYGKKPVEIMPSLIRYCDVVMGNIWACRDLLGIDIDQEACDQKDWNRASHSCIDKLKLLYSNIKTIAFTYRFDNEKGGVDYSALLYHKGLYTWSDQYYSNNVVDKVGSGDTFMAALIYGLRNNLEDGQIINFCSKAALTKLGEYSDHTSTSVEQIYKTSFQDNIKT